MSYFQNSVTILGKPTSKFLIKCNGVLVPYFSFIDLNKVYRRCTVIDMAVANNPVAHWLTINVETTSCILVPIGLHDRL